MCGTCGEPLQSDNKKPKCFHLETLDKDFGDSYFMVMVGDQALRNYLIQDLAHRRAQNPRFSLRAYAKVLGLSAPHLSQILANKRKVTPRSAMQISENLGLSPSETLDVMGATAPSSLGPYRVLDSTEFNPISEWYYYAILGLANLKSNVADPRWIARRLNLSLPIAERAFEKLLSYQHIEVVRGHFRQCTSPLRTKDDVPSAAIRQYHRQQLHLAAAKLEQVDVSLREFTSMTLPINLARLKTAKNLIRKFKEAFTDEVSRGPKTEVYNLNIQFFPVTEIPKKVTNECN